MTIINYRHRPKRKPKAKAVASAITGPRIVSTSKPGKGAKPAKELPDDPEADARVAEFFQRMVKPR
jgi:hypothetical protein